MGKLQNKVVIITGGAGGIGSGMAKSMVKEGAIVTIVDLNTQADLDLSFGTGFYPTFYLMQAALPHLKETKG